MVIALDHVLQRHADNHCRQTHRSTCLVPAYSRSVSNCEASSSISIIDSYLSCTAINCSASPSIRIIGPYLSCTAIQFSVSRQQRFYCTTSNPTILEHI
ncbi:hypothetical protein B9Z55_007846 [Caenorhabditis nigoni]|uniref:Uncharacterized protein n=1 Tax=Caenorhabditis nigoni TaxID=1611254 RepID=A0A2G5VC66_9PELO|nr:hypothetical protein B9Z55_007846 [Caenorhabditis nigoni]